MYLEVSCVWLNRKQLDSHISFCIQSCNILCWLKYMKKSCIIHTRGWKRKRYFSQHLTSGSFLKESCSVESETISLNFPFLVIWKSVVYLALRMNLSPVYDFITLCIGCLGNTGSLSYTFFPQSWHISLCSNKTKKVVNVTSNLIRSP